MKWISIEHGFPLDQQLIYIKMKDGKIWTAKYDNYSDDLESTHNFCLWLDFGVLGDLLIASKYNMPTHWSEYKAPPC